MASSPNVRRSPNSATGADAESAAAADAAAAFDAAAATTEAEKQVVWKRPNMRGSKCSINGYVRLGIVKTIIVELRSVGDDTSREFRESCLGHFIREEWRGFVPNAALHALFSNEVVRPDAQVDEFWFRIGHRMIRFSRYKYASVTSLRFGDSDFDVHGDDVPPEGSMYDRYPLLSQQSGDALKVAKVLCVCYLIFGVDGGKRIADRWLWMLVEDQTRWESFPWGLYSYQILVTYLSDVPTEVPAGLDPGYHFYSNIYAIIFGIMLGASFIQRPRCTRWKLKKLGHIDFTTFFDDERIVRHRTSGPVILAQLYLTSGRESSGEPHDLVHTDHQCQSSPIRGPRQTASSSARGTHETAPIIDFDTLFTRMHTCIQSAVQDMRQFVDAVVEKSVKDVCRHIDELVSQSASLDTSPWDFEGINELMRNSQIEPLLDGAPIPPEQTMSVSDAGVSSLPIETHVDGALSPTEQTEEILVTPLEIAHSIRLSSSTADLSPIPLEYSSTTIPADTYHLSRLQYRSYRPHFPFSTTVVRKRKDLDEEAYIRWLDSGDSVNVGAACRASASWFLMLQDASTLIDAEHLDAYMGILQFDPGFVGVRWLDDWAAHTVLATCINIWNNSKRKGGPLSIDDEDLDFLVSHIHGPRPFWCDHRPWWELCEEDDAYLKLRSQQSLGISFLIPTILQRSGFYERCLDITPVPLF
ncbi:hypothetical protein OROMI_001568 [Orobanche minor]